MPRDFVPKDKGDKKTTAADEAIRNADKPTGSRFVYDDLAGLEFFPADDDEAE